MNRVNLARNQYAEWDRIFCATREGKENPGKKLKRETKTWTGFVLFLATDRRQTPAAYAGKILVFTVG